MELEDMPMGEDPDLGLALAKTDLTERSAPETSPGVYARMAISINTATKA